MNVKRHVANQVNPILAYNEDAPTCGIVCVCVAVTVCLHCERFKLQRRENSCCCCCFGVNVLRATWRS